MDNEYLQEKVMGECFKYCWNGNSSNPACHKCKTLFDGHDRPRDFSTPVDYCALEDKMRELQHAKNKLGSYWCDFIAHLRHNNIEYIFIAADRTQRAALIAEYWRHK